MTVCCHRQNAPIGRRSPGRKAYFSSVHPAPVSWTGPAGVALADSGRENNAGCFEEKLLKQFFRAERANTPLKRVINESGRAFSNRVAGFTLIEVLLALAISAIVLVAISLAFAGALQLREHASARLDQSLPAERAMDLMRRDLKNVVPPGLMLAGPLQSGAFQGGVDANDGIQIYTTTGLITANDPWADIQKVTYGLQSSSDATNSSKDLIRAVTRNLLATGPEDEDDQRLMGGVESLTFSYFDGTQWLDTWDDTTQTNLPFAVRVNLQLAATDSSSPPPQPVQLLVPLMAQVDTNLLNAWENMTNSTAGGGGANNAMGGSRAN